MNQLPSYQPVVNRPSRRRDPNPAFRKGLAWCIGGILVVVLSGIFIGLGIFTNIPFLYLLSCWLITIWGGGIVASWIYLRGIQWQKSHTLSVIILLVSLAIAWIFLTIQPWPLMVSLLVIAIGLTLLWIVKLYPTPGERKESQTDPDKNLLKLLFFLGVGMIFCLWVLYGLLSSLSWVTEFVRTQCYLVLMTLLIICGVLQQFQIALLRRHQKSAIQSAIRIAVDAYVAENKPVTQAELKKFKEALVVAIGKAIGSQLDREVEAIEEILKRK